MNAPLAIGGTRLVWTELPRSLRTEIETAAGSPVRTAESKPGGFSPGLASVLRLEDGRSVFVKAVNGARNPDSPDMHRREARMLAVLPATAPAPRLLWNFDDGDWVVLMTEAVAGAAPTTPWQLNELELFLETVSSLAAELTPAPAEAPTIQDSHRETFTGWRRLASEPDLADQLDPWARRRVDRLAEVEREWPAAAAGQTLLHADLRADNVLLTGTGAVIVDWPHACTGAAWIELLFALPSIAMHGGGDPQQLWQRYPPGRAADPAAVTAVLTALTGFFLERGLRPPPPNLPRLRAFQRAQGQAGLDWLRRRLAP